MMGAETTYYVEVRRTTTGWVRKYGITEDDAIANAKMDGMNPTGKVRHWADFEETEE